MATEELLQRRLTRARFALAALGVLVAVCAIAVGVTIWYWLSYLRGPSHTAFTRGPYLLRVTLSEAALRWRVRGGKPVTLTAVAQDGTPVKVGCTAQEAAGSGVAHRGRAPGAPRAGGGLWVGRDAISETHDAVSEAALVEELQVDAMATGQCGLASTDDHGPDEEPALVNEPGIESLCREVCAPHG